MIYLTKVYENDTSETLYFNKMSEAKKVQKKSAAIYNKVWFSGDNFRIEVIEGSIYSTKDVVSEIEFITEVISEILNKNKKANIRITRFEDD